MLLGLGEGTSAVVGRSLLSLEEEGSLVHWGEVRMLGLVSDWIWVMVRSMAYT